MPDNIEYAILRSPKRKTLSIIIRSNSQVDVLAPQRMPEAVIHQFVQNKQTWIQKKLHFNHNIRASYQAKLFQQGELFQLLGKSYRLNIHNHHTEIHIADAQLIVPALPADKLKQKIIIWYKQQAQQHCQQRAQHFSASIGKTPASIGVKAYKSRWGSCHQDGRIYFNYRLIMAPARIIDYVIVHELCHLIHHNHGKDFWQRVESIMPDYHQANTWLKNNGLSLDL
ncbi:MAG: SprT family zinc-dependent metalloprotease [Mariprofundus sp.]|nr:SprT family zinc-dependent metalloprotease [Mariprofundus sp.]